MGEQTVRRRSAGLSLLGPSSMKVPSGSSMCRYAVLRGEKAPDDALALELGAKGLL
ncbi:hypothetical protein AKJ08_3149 [Vulgatibacter incomptus]|uniref:Uncharacterized protein n=1 Tax=Vulgatibacter incomptus TaxID=1391653 RepID=A0A0K1PGY6_9BACT|nr:hypothetical protein AKJ08_3149 [Vulgatibacter incomptus]